MSVVDTRNAFTAEYQKVLEKIEESGECPAPFCKDKDDHHSKPIEFTGTYWKVTRNNFNYQNALFAFLLIPIRHVESFLDIRNSEWKDLRSVIRWLVHTHKLRGYTLVWRMGDKSHTGASVSHLHAHLICGDERPNKPQPQWDDSDKVMVLAGFAKKDKT